MDRGIEVSGVTVRYGDLVAVDDVTLTVPLGFVVAISGPSGAGKSSLLWAMAGALTPHSGKVLVDGAAVQDRAEAAGRGVVLIPQGNGLARMLTARENISVPLLAARQSSGRRRRRDTRPDREPDPRGADVGAPAQYRRPGVDLDLGERVYAVEEEAVDEIAGRIDEALAAVGLEESGNHLVEELSGGEQQRVAVARGLAQRGGAILADESTSELDSTNRERIVGLLRAEARRGAAVVIATHDPEVAAEADAHAVLDEGHLTWTRALFT